MAWLVDTNVFSELRMGDACDSSVAAWYAEAPGRPCGGRGVGRLNVPDPVPSVDGLLAATALVHGLVLVTRDTHAVARTGVLILDPFAAG